MERNKEQGSSFHWLPVEVHWGASGSIMRLFTGEEAGTEEVLFSNQSASVDIHSLSRLAKKPSFVAQMLVNMRKYFDQYSHLYGEMFVLVEWVF